MELQGKILINYMNSENPFRWKPHAELEIIPEDMIGKIKQKMAEKIAEDEMEYESVMFPLILCYEYHVKNQLTEALKYLKNAEDKIEFLENDQNNSSLHGRFLPALRHLISSTKTHILLEMNNLNDAYKESCEIRSVSKDPVIWGLKALFYGEYGIFGTRVGLKYASKANEMNPDDSMWYFLKGKFLGRIRRVEKPFDIPSEVELKCLETALNKEMRPAYTIFTAQIFREKARLIYRKMIMNNTLYCLVKDQIDEMNKKSFHLYNKSLELKPKCPHMKFRCAKGFIMLPVPYKDDDLAEKLLNDGLKLAPDSPYGHHTAAQFYERCKKDNNKAKHHLRIAAKNKVYGAAIDLLRLELKDNDITKVQAVSKLEKFFEEYVEFTRRCQSLAQLTSYYIFEKQDIHKAFEYFRKILEIDVTNLNILDHRSIFLDYRNTFSLRDVIVDEIKLALQDKNCKMEERKTLTDYFSELRDLGVEIKLEQPMYLKNSIQKKIGSNQPKANRGHGPRPYQYNNRNQRNQYRNTVGTMETDSQDARKACHDSYVTESNVCHQINRFGEEWKKHLKSNQPYRASNYSRKDNRSENEKTKFVDDDDFLSSIGIRVYNETRMHQKFLKRSDVQGLARFENNQPQREKNVASKNANNSESAVKMIRKNLGSSCEYEPSKIGHLLKKNNTFNEHDDLDTLTKTIVEENSTIETKSNDDFDQMMANYRKMKISHSHKMNDGNVIVSESNSRRNEKTKSCKNDGKTSHRSSSGRKLPESSCEEKQKNLNLEKRDDCKDYPQRGIEAYNKDKPKYDSRGNLKI